MNLKSRSARKQLMAFALLLSYTLGANAQYIPQAEKDRISRQGGYQPQRQPPPMPQRPPPTIEEAYDAMRRAGVSPPSCEGLYFSNPWGAIYESADGAIHQSHCQDNRQSAEDMARLFCERHGRGACRLAVSANAQVVAITRGEDGRNFIVANRSGKKAVREANKQCQKAGSSKCSMWFLYDSRTGPMSPDVRY